MKILLTALSIILISTLVYSVDLYHFGYETDDDNSSYSIENIIIKERFSCLYSGIIDTLYAEVICDGIDGNKNMKILVYDSTSINLVGCTQNLLVIAGSVGEQQIIAIPCTILVNIETYSLSVWSESGIGNGQARYKIGTADSSFYDNETFDVCPDPGTNTLVATNRNYRIWAVVDTSTPTDTHNEYFNGYIDEVRISNMIRSNFYHVFDPAICSLGVEEER